MAATSSKQPRAKLPEILRKHTTVSVYVVQEEPFTNLKKLGDATIINRKVSEHSTSKKRRWHVTLKWVYHPKMVTAALKGLDTLPKNIKERVLKEIRGNAHQHTYPNSITLEEIRPLKKQSYYEGSYQKSNGTVEYFVFGPASDKTLTRRPEIAWSL